MFEDRESYSPLVLFEYDHNPGTYCLLLSDRHMVSRGSPFDVPGREGNGYDWTDLALEHIRRLAPEMEGQIQLDPEAGMFVAYGSDLSALQSLGAILHAVYHNGRAGQ